MANLPALNAILNGLSAVLLTVGYLCIRRRRIVAHRTCMVAAFVTSVVFLASYLTLRYYAGMTRFTAEGWIRPVYFTILGTHTALAATVVPLALVTLGLAVSAGGLGVPLLGMVGDVWGLSRVFTAIAAIAGLVWLASLNLPVPGASVVRRSARGRSPRWA